MQRLYIYMNPILSMNKIYCVIGIVMEVGTSNDISKSVYLYLT